MTSFPSASAGLRITLFVGLAAAVASPLAAQVASTGRIVGAVTDDSGGVLPGVRVELTGERIMGTQTFTTDEDGQYRFGSLPPGVYELTFALSGFGTTKRTDVRVRVGATLEEDVTLKVGALAVAITVEASVAVVDTTSTKVETNYDRDWIDNSPNQRRSFIDILISAPGIDPAGSAQEPQPASYGSNVDQNLYQLDGVDLTDHFNGNATTMVRPSIDTIEQVEVLSLGAPAEYGWHEGAVFNVVTRQGTNRFRGGGAFYYQNDGLTDRNTTEAFDGGNPFTRLKYHNFTAQLGGPIVKDKLWFFAAYERLDDSFALLRERDAAGSEELDHYLAKLNFQITPGHQLTGVVNYDKNRQDDGRFPEQAPETATGTGRKTWTPSVSYTGAVDRDTAVEAQYAGFYVVHNCCGEGGGRKVIGTRFENLDTGVTTGATGSWYEYHVQKTSLSAKVSHHASDFLGASHDFKFGVQWSDAPGSGQYGVNDVVYTTDFQSGYGYDYTPYGYGGTVKTLGAFVDDSVQVGDRLRINAGVRYDNIRSRFTEQPVLDELGNRTSGTVPGLDVYTWNTISPRLGFNLKLTEDGKTVLKTHYGRYHRGGSTGEWVAFASPTRVVALRGDWDFQTSQFVDTEVAFSPSNASVDPDIEPARTDQFVVSLERELFGSLNLGATYLLKRGRTLSNWTDMGGIYAPFSYVDNEGAEASGRTLTLFRLQNSPADRRFLLTTGRGTSADVDAFTLTATKRMTSNWQVIGSLTLQKATSANIFGQTAQLNFRSFGRDPNQYVNSDGLAVRDRTVLAKLQFLRTDLPLGLTFGLDWGYYTGYPTIRQVRVPATGLASTVQTEPRTDDKRFPSQNLLNVRLQKDIRLGRGDSRLSLLASVFNVFNDDAVLTFRSLLATSALYHQPASVVHPRRAMLGAKVEF
jgi:outer membrane receptor protein involved in Fe transport